MPCFIINWEKGSNKSSNKIYIIQIFHSGAYSSKSRMVEQDTGYNFTDNNCLSFHRYVIEKLLKD